MFAPFHAFNNDLTGPVKWMKLAYQEVKCKHNIIFWEMLVSGFSQQMTDGHASLLTK